jgi:hypothetical protein
LGKKEGQATVLLCLPFFGSRHRVFLESDYSFVGQIGHPWQRIDIEEQILMTAVLPILGKI